MFANSSLRERFKADSKNSSMISRPLNETCKVGLIKISDDSTSDKNRNIFLSGHNFYLTGGWLWAISFTISTVMGTIYLAIWSMINESFFVIVIKAINWRHRRVLTLIITTASWKHYFHKAISQQADTFYCCALSRFSTLVSHFSPKNFWGRKNSLKKFTKIRKTAQNGRFLWSRRVIRKCENTNKNHWKHYIFTAWTHGFLNNLRRNCHDKFHRRVLLRKYWSPGAKLRAK